MKFQQLMQDVTAIQAAGMPEDLASGDHVKDGPRHAIGDAAADVTGIMSLRLPQVDLPRQ